MCKLSGPIKFCTCNGAAVDRNASYWEYFQYRKHKNVSMIGELRMPYEVDPQTEAHNLQLLQEAVNDPSSFDFDCKPYDGDRFLISIKCQGDEDARLNYGFEFSKGQWRPKNFHPFEWEEKHDITEQGKLS